MVRPSLHQVRPSNPLPIALCATVVATLQSCGGSAPSRPAWVGPGRLYAEQHLTGVIRLADSVLVSLEVPGQSGGIGDTGSSGTDQWPLRVDRRMTIGFGIAGVPDVGLSIEDSRGVPVADVRSGQPSTTIALAPGQYQIRVQNLGTRSRHLWVGWNASPAAGRARTTPGIYVTELADTPTSIAGVATSTPIIIGLGGLEVDAPTPLKTYRDFKDLVTGPSPRLDACVRLYYENGGGSAYFVTIPNTSPSAYRAALGQVQNLLGTTASVVLAPDVASLDVTAWGAATKALIEGVGDGAVVIIDPPAEARALTDVPSLRAALSGLQSRSYGCIYFPYLIDSSGVAQAPSGAAAGVWVANDERVGVWNSPAGASFPLSGVVRTEIPITNADEGPLNAPLDGYAINALRQFPGSSSTLIWGARTLDGNSEDYRYIAVRRTLIYIEQSLKLALQSFVFAPNDSQTWSAVTSMFSSFLTDLWQAGGLVGNSASQAFSVQCGLGTTMTEQDILDGYLNVQIAVATVFPAEFIVIEFQQVQATS